jgi:phage shock protein A
MSVFQRVRDLCSANLHLTLDQWEDPEAMLGQAIREMESELAGALQAAASMIALEKLMSRRIGEHESGVQDWDRKARQELSAGREAKARQALRRKLEDHRILPGLREQLDLLKANRHALRRRVADMSGKLAEARRMRSALAARQFAATVRENSARVRSGSGFARFEQIRDRVEHAEAVADAWLALDDEDVADDGSRGDVDQQVEAELADLQRDQSTGTT